MTKKIALHHVHESLGAKMIPFAGYEMPVSYTGVIEEHLNVRHTAGIFDVSHMGEFFVEGEEALELLQKICSNDVSRLSPGRVQYTCMPNGRGGIVDDLLVYCMAEGRYMLVVNASNIAKDWAWIMKQAEGAKVELSDHSDRLSLFAVQGPRAAELLQPLCDQDLSSMKYYHFDVMKLGGIDDVIVSATGYTGAGGFELYVPNEHAEALWHAIMQAGEGKGLRPIGLAARDTLRLEMGFCLYGNDIDDNTSAIEAGLGWITKFNKDFIDKDLLEKQKQEGTKRKLVGFVMEDRGIPRQHYPILNAQGEAIGEVTSGTQSPSLGKAIGMGYVQTAYAKEGESIYIDMRGKGRKAVIHKPPFYKGED